MHYLFVNNETICSRKFYSSADYLITSYQEAGLLPREVVASLRQTRAFAVKMRGKATDRWTIDAISWLMQIGMI